MTRALLALPLAALLAGCVTRQPIRLHPEQAYRAPARARPHTPATASARGPAGTTSPEATPDNSTAPAAKLSEAEKEALFQRFNAHLSHSDTSHGGTE